MDLITNPAQHGVWFNCTVLTTGEAFDLQLNRVETDDNDYDDHHHGYMYILYAE